VERNIGEGGILLHIVSGVVIRQFANKRPGIDIFCEVGLEPRGVLPRIVTPDQPVDLFADWNGESEFLGEFIRRAIRQYGASIDPVELKRKCSQGIAGVDRSCTQVSVVSGYRGDLYPG